MAFHLQYAMSSHKAKRTIEDPSMCISPDHIPMTSNNLSHLVVAEYRAVLTGMIGADGAVLAFAHAALHVPLHGYINI